MKVVVFGATGSVGRLTVETLLDAGHVVTAFARASERLGLSHENLRRMSGDALNAEDVAQAVRGQDAVIVTLGSGMSRKSVVRSEGTLNIIKAMHTHDVSRLVCQSTLGIGESWQTLNFWWKFVMFGALLAPVFRDHQVQEKLVQASGLDWTIVRPAAFTDSATLRPVVKDVPNTARGLDLKVARSDVARFLAEELTDRFYIGRAVGLSS
ncbi:NAD(P)-dependent oxidoreductase [Roseobacter denitrificans]|uniref:NAD(P)-binding domain-containing protein n=1 Tax=Roseobacter denitrificans (strain ATCC 33942 / OCh 114) TaxID=375451 RepID=Q16B51_ROSDO|nr:NAD(P)-binding oxidoreductase [Roseobacter denitrificans]ABG30792.1 conserved hypothetical protein [Roseobacter denitrificans OCh 114]AVL53899.1 NAD(P)-dependent oxidoreductase [Roseobacter denitrificans]SFG46622.1 Uncharacterized conserved protein YbjT, contains NAD(P)-binding and DUF2867 domains [Roseobacter denitrificans OCh 114]